jgi:predicted phage-related endonuclease
MDEKATGITQEPDDFTQRRFALGHEYEAQARPWAEEIIGEELFPAIIAADVQSLPLSASLDGITMDESVTWEHKTLNESLRESLEHGEIPHEYHYQMEQGLLLSGAKRCLFMASNGDRESMRYAWYERNIDTAKELITGWVQFKSDLDEHEPQVETVTPVARAIRELPYLNIKVTGAITESNLAQYREAATSYIQSINTELATDEDFANAEADVKFCEQAEKTLKQAKVDALSQTREIDDLMKTIDYIAEQLRQKRLTLDKLVTAEKQNRKIQIATQARDAYADHIRSLEKELAGLTLSTAQVVNWNDALKNKRTIASLQDAADTALANAKIAANEAAKAMRENLSMLARHGDEYQHLFTDLQSIIMKQADDFKMVVETRIQAENDRREQVAQAERERAERERAAQAERERVEREQAAQAAEKQEPPQPAALAMENENTEDGYQEAVFGTNSANAVATYPTDEEIFSTPGGMDCVTSRQTIMSDEFVAQIDDWRKAHRVSKKAVDELMEIITSAES